MGKPDEDDGDGDDADDIRRGRGKKQILPRPVIKVKAWHIHSIHIKVSSIKEGDKDGEMDMSKYSGFGSVLSMVAVICLPCHRCWIISCNETP